MWVHYWTVLVTCMACVGRPLSVDILCSDDVCSFLCVCLLSVTMFLSTWLKSS